MRQSAACDSSAFDAGDHIGSVTIEVVCGAAEDRAGIEPRPHGRRRRRRRWRRVLLLDQQAGGIQRHALRQNRRDKAARGHEADNEPAESKMPTWHFLCSKQRILPGGTRGGQQWLGRPDNDWHAGP